MKRLIFIIVLTALAVFVVWPQHPGNYIPDGDALPGNPGIHLGNFVRQGAKLGLDLQGGTQLTLQADLNNVPADQQSSAMQGVLNVIERRVNAYGVAEPERPVPLDALRGRRRHQRLGGEGQEPGRQRHPRADGSPGRRLDLCARRSHRRRHRVVSAPAARRLIGEILGSGHPVVW